MDGRVEVGTIKAPRELRGNLVSMNKASQEMWKRLHNAVAADEAYLLAMAIASLETRLTLEPEKLEQAFGSYGIEVAKRFLGN